MKTNFETGQAIESYRALLRAQLVAEEAEHSLHVALNNPKIDMEIYTSATMDIDRRISEAEEAADGAGYARSTRAQRIRAAIHDGGRN